MSIKIKHRHTVNATFDPAPGGVWGAVIAYQEGLTGGTSQEGDLAMKPKHVAAFKCGYVAAFERLVRTEDLVGLLTNFMTMVERQATPTADHGLTEARRFVQGLNDELYMADWLQDMEVPVDSDNLARPLKATNTPSLNEIAVSFLMRDDELMEGQAQG